VTDPAKLRELAAEACVVASSEHVTRQLAISKALRAAADEIERLRAESVEIGEVLGAAIVETVTGTNAMWLARITAERYTKASAEVDRLREALRPFAELPLDMPDMGTIEGSPVGRQTLFDMVLRARAALGGE
jgi:hypothetical protein